jgi:hypothetical protein
MAMLKSCGTMPGWRSAPTTTFARRDEDDADLDDRREPDRRHDRLPQPAHLVDRVGLDRDGEFLVVVEQRPLVKAMQRDAHRLLLGHEILMGEGGEQVGEIEAERLLRVSEPAHPIAWRITPIGITSNVQQIEAELATLLLPAHGLRHAARDRHVERRDGRVGDRRLQHRYQFGRDGGEIGDTPCHGAPPQPCTRP